MAGWLAGVVERAWSPRTAADRAVQLGLRPLAAAYGAAVGVRNALYDAGWLPTTRVAARVISIGNLTVGGTGKTPAALWLADRLVARGHRVGIVARGYRKRRPGVVVVGTDGEPLVAPEEGGDEAVMLAHRFAGPVVTGERRAEAAAAAVAQFRLDTVVLDDGFQHRALHRDADLVLVSGDPAAGRLLPAGSRREPLASLARARAVLAVGDGAPPTPTGLPRFAARIEATALVEAATWRTSALAALDGATVVAVSGVARPERFAALLAGCGARVRRHIVFPDHHSYASMDVAGLIAASAEGLLVTTEKDLVKLAEIPGLRALHALRVQLVVERAEALVDLLLA
jgi:tetraacyldisaccharide 4'-kinase